jgi:hypothetical protein
MRPHSATSQRGLAIKVLQEAGKPLTVSEIASGIRDLGFVHRTEPRRKNQLLNSLVALMIRDPAFKRVAKGTYDLASR